MSAQQSLTIEDNQGDTITVTRSTEAQDSWEFGGVVDGEAWVVYVSDEDAKALVAFLNGNKLSVPYITHNQVGGLTPGGTCR